MENSDREHNKHFLQALNVAFRYLSFRSRTVHETRTHLLKKKYTDDFVDDVIEFLIQKNYLNDENFAEQYVSEKANRSPRSKFAFRYELIQKKIDPEIVDRLLESYNDGTLAEKAVSLRRARWRNLDPDEQKKKLINFLRYRGFSYDTCLSVITNFFNPHSTHNKDKSP